MSKPEGHPMPAASERRTFLTQLCASGLLCMGCGRTALAERTCDQEQRTIRGPVYKFSADSNMTFEQVFDFTYAMGFIPLLQAVANEVGREKFLPMLQEAASRLEAERAKKLAPPAPNNTLAAMHPAPDHFWSHVISTDWVKNTETVHDVRVTECLWAKTYRDANASDIGYAITCHTDFAFARAFNPKIRFTRTKTLMQGHDCCNPRWELEA